MLHTTESLTGYPKEGDFGNDTLGNSQLPHSPLNFKNLFADQPAADFFPLRPWDRKIHERPPSPSDLQKDTELIEHIISNHPPMSALSPSQRARTAPTIGGAGHRDRTRGNSERGVTSGSARVAGLPRHQTESSRVFSPISKSFKGLFANDLEGTAGYSNNGKGDLKAKGLEDESQGTAHSDLRSLAFNPRSEQQLSLKVSLSSWWHVVIRTE